MKNFVSGLYKNFTECDARLMRDAKEEFESIAGIKVDKNTFDALYVNAKYFPGFSTIQGGFMIPLYLESKGRLAKASSSLYKKFSRKPVESSKLSTDRRQLLDQLAAEGYCVVENFLDAAQVEKFKAEMKSFDYHAAGDATKKNYKVDQLRTSDAMDHPTASVYHSKLIGSDVDMNSELGRSMINPFITEIASAYFETPAYLSDVTSIFTKPKDPKTFTNLSLHHNAQSWHLDMTPLRFLTCFLYLTDVKPENGPHTFATNTHEDKMIYPTDKKDFYEAGFRTFPNGQIFGQVRDEWVLNAVGPKRIKEFCCPKGTLIIENTTGLHKGGYCLAGTREIVSYTYCISNTGRPSAQPTLNYQPDFPYNSHLMPMLKCLKQEQVDKFNDFAAVQKTFTSRIKGKIKTLVGAKAKPKELAGMMS